MRLYLLRIVVPALGCVFLMPNNTLAPQQPVTPSDVLRSSGDAFRTQLIFLIEQEARTFDLDINSNESLYCTSGIGNIAFAPIRQLPLLSLEEFAAGPTIGLVFLSKPPFGLSSAFYGLKITISDVLQVELVNAAGIGVAQLPAQIISVPGGFIDVASLFDLEDQGDVGVNSTSRRKSLFLPIDRLFIVKINF